MTVVQLPRLVLASASPRRAELLRAARFDFVVRPVNVDESIREGERPSDYVTRVAIDKARAAARADQDVVLAADTTVVADGQILAKPADEADAARMLRLLAGRRHEVLTAVCLLRGEWLEAQVEISVVEFLPMSDEEIAWYVGTGEPMDKAGAYGIQGGASRFVARLEGSYTNVVGLPVGLVYRMWSKLMGSGPHDASVSTSDPAVVEDAADPRQE